MWEAATSRSPTKSRLAVSRENRPSIWRRTSLSLLATSVLDLAQNVRRASHPSHTYTECAHLIIIRRMIS
jgi:hypothetical protein